MVATYNLQDLRRIEKALSEPLDVEGEAFRARQFRYMRDGLQIIKAPTSHHRAIYASDVSGRYSDGLFSNGSAGAALATFTAESSMYAASQPNAWLAAGFFDATYGLGKTVRVTCRGIYSTTGTPTFTIGFRQDTLAGTLWGTSLAITSQSGVANLVWELEFDIIAQAPLLASAHNEVPLVVMGLISGVSTGSNGFANGSALGTQTPTTPLTLTTVDATHYLFPTVACGTSSASNKWQMLQMVVQGLN